MAGSEGGRPYRLGGGLIDSPIDDMNTWMTPNYVPDIETMNVVMTRVCGLMSQVGYTDSDHILLYTEDPSSYLNLKYSDCHDDERRPSSRHISRYTLDFCVGELLNGRISWEYQQNINHDLLLNRVYNIGDNVRVRSCWPCLEDDGLPSCNPLGRQCLGRSGQTYWHEMR